jgi:hypothetical protein
MSIRLTSSEDVSGPLLKRRSPGGKQHMRIDALMVAIGLAILPPLALAQDSCGLPNAGGCCTSSA